MVIFPIEAPANEKDESCYHNDVDDDDQHSDMAQLHEVWEKKVANGRQKFPTTKPSFVPDVIVQDIPSVVLDRTIGLDENMNQGGYEG